MDRSFNGLRSPADAPQLPAGYPALIPIALIPPHWFALLDRRLTTIQRPEVAMCERASEGAAA